MKKFPEAARVFDLEAERKKRVPLAEQQEQLRQEIRQKIKGISGIHLLQLCAQVLAAGGHMTQDQLQSAPMLVAGLFSAASIGLLAYQAGYTNGKASVNTETVTAGEPMNIGTTTKRRQIAPKTMSENLNGISSTIVQLIFSFAPTLAILQAASQQADRNEDQLLVQLLIGCGLMKVLATQCQLGIRGHIRTATEKIAENMAFQKELRKRAN